MLLKKIMLIGVMIFLPIVSGCSGQLRQEVDRLKKAEMQNALEIAQLRLEVNRLRGDVARLKAAGGKLLEGKVTAIGERMITISLGAPDGARAGHQFNIIREKKVIGTLRVFEPYRDFSICTVESIGLNEKGKKYKFKEGDLVRQDLGE